MKPHPDFERLKELFPAVREYQELAKKHGINDVFQDNGGKILQVCLALNLTVTGQRMGNDAKDETGKEFELKTVNLLNRSPSFTTHHHLNPTILAKYRQVDWIFATYQGIELREIYRLTPEQMEHWFSQWEAAWHSKGGKDLNNPKVPVPFVRRRGWLVYSNVGEALEQAPTRLSLPPDLQDRPGRRSR